MDRDKREIEVAIIGAGPAGLAAAAEAAGAGANVIVFDEHLVAGGQLFKQIHKFFGSWEHHAGIRGLKIGSVLFDDALASGVELSLGSTVFGVFAPNNLAVVRNGAVENWSYRKLILACGATENCLAFPGSTLPGVLTAGAAQTMVNIHRVLPGKRILTIGAGNVGLIVSYQMLQAGAEVLGIMDVQEKINGYGVHAAKLRRRGVNFYLRHTVLGVQGSRAVETAVIAAMDAGGKVIAGSEKELAVDTVLLAVGLSPMTELVEQAGCRLSYIGGLGGFVPVHDDTMRSSVENVFVCGDVTGVEEASVAIEEGRMAGISAAESLGYYAKTEAAKRRADIWRRLTGLRSGEFGNIRQQWKRQLLEEAGNDA